MRLTGLVAIALAFAIALIAFTLAARADDAHGSTTTFRDRAGNVTGTSHTDYAGNTTFRDRAGNVVGTATRR